MLLKRISILLITLRFVSCSSMWPIYHGQCSMCTWKIHVFCCLWSGEGNGNPLQYSCLENPVDRGAWWAAVQRVIQSQIWLKWLSMHACIGEGNGSPLQYSYLARIPRTEEPGGLPFMGSHRVGHDWSDLTAASAAFGWTALSISMKFILYKVSFKASVHFCISCIDDGSTDVSGIYLNFHIFLLGWFPDIM